MLLNKKVSWLLLIAFITFDNIFSYFAIVYYGMREWNPTTSFLVSITPLFYFVSIPLTIIFLYLIIKLVGWSEEKFSRGKKLERELNEQIITACLMFAWGIGVTSFNLITLLRKFFPLRVRYEIFLVAGILVAIVYGIYAEWLIKKRKYSKNKQI